MDMNKSDFLASLQRLESMAKGGSTQLYHTPSDSDVGSWAGTGTKDGQDEHNDGIDDNGTDYAGVRKALAGKVERQKALSKAEVAIVKGQDPRPAIMEKIAKGERLTQAESWALKGGVAKMMKGTDMPKGGAELGGTADRPGEARTATQVPDTHAGGDETEIEADAKKSLAGGIARQPNLSKGLEMSPILAEFARAMGEGLRGVEARTAQTIQKSLLAALEPVFSRVGNIEKSLARAEEFQKGFSDAIIGIGQHVAGGAEVAQHQAHMPAYAPQSHLRAVPPQQQQQFAPQQGVQAVQKSFGPGGLDVGSSQLQKSQIINVMTDLVEKGKLNSLDVVKFETSNEINPHVQHLVSQALAGQA